MSDYDPEVVPLDAPVTVPEVVPDVDFIDPDPGTATEPTGRNGGE